MEVDGVPEGAPKRSTSGWKKPYLYIKFGNCDARSYENLWPKKCPKSRIELEREAVSIQFV